MSRILVIQWRKGIESDITRTDYNLLIGLGTGKGLKKREPHKCKDFQLSSIVLESKQDSVLEKLASFSTLVNGVCPVIKRRLL